MFIFFINLYYFPKTGIFFTFISIILPIIVHFYISDVHNPIDLYKFSLAVFLILYGIPINIIVCVIKMKKKKIEQLEKDLGLRLVKEANEVKDDDDIKKYNDKNSKHLEYVKIKILENLKKENSRSLSKLTKINKKLENHKNIENLKKEMIKKHPFIKKLI